MAPMPIADAAFLIAERREQPMHVGGLELFTLPSGAGDDFVRELYEQMISTPEVATLFRRRAHRPPTSAGAWSWQLDNDVDLEHHIRHSALPRPGRVRELLALSSRLHGSLLDRQRPLWEAHLIEGLDGGRFAVYTKIHHALVDGVSALRLLENSLSSDPDDKGPSMPWSVEQKRDPSEAPAGPVGGLLGISRAALRATTELAGMAPAAARAAARSLMDQSSYLPSAAPKTIFNVQITGARRFAAQSWPLERIRAVGKASGSTINDVVLAMCSSALRGYLKSLDALPEAPLIAMTPVSLRQAGADTAAGNAVGAVLCNLGTDIDDATGRLEAVKKSMGDAKASLRGKSPGQVQVMSAAAMLPMLLTSVPGVRRVTSPTFNLTISNVPGPQHPLYLAGAEMEGVYPLSIPTDGQALNITVTSYNGNMDFGLTGCRRSVPHLQRMLTFLGEGLDELEAATN